MPEKSVDSGKGALSLDKNEGDHLKGSGVFCNPYSCCPAADIITRENNVSNDNESAFLILINIEI